MKLLTAKPDHRPALFIQCKGFHSGRPLLEYIPNSFSLFTDDEFAFEKSICIFHSRVYEQYLIGSVIPFIRIDDAHYILYKGFQELELHPKPTLDALHKIETLIRHYDLQLVKWKQCQLELSRSLIRVNTFRQR